MPVFIAILYNLAQPYWDTLQKKLTGDGISSLTLIHGPNLIGHPLGIAVLMGLGIFFMPTSTVFYASWLGVIILAAVTLTLHIWGLMKTKFFGVQVLKRLGFLATTLAAILFLGERVTLLQTAALALATLAILLFAWPERRKGARLAWDAGVLYILLSLVIGAFGAILYKLATLHTPDYFTFLTGRFVVDLIVWTVIWGLVLFFFNKRNPVGELVACLKNSAGWKLLLGGAATSLLSSWLIYELPVTTFAMLGTFTVPSAYLWSRFKYNEHVTGRMWAGTILSVSAILLFLYPPA